jgi:hypothetical protein
MFGVAGLLTAIDWVRMGQVPFPDWLVFHGAVRAYFAGQEALIYDLEGITGYQNALYADHLERQIYFRPFMYPPTWLLLLLPFGLLGVFQACIVFLLTTAGVAHAALGRLEWRTSLAVLASPAALWVVISGQNAILSTALFYGGLRVVDRSPAVAGVLLGLLTYKPQLWALIPIALCAARQWRALAWAVGTGVVFALCSGMLFGFDFWLGFIEASRDSATPAFAELMFQRMSMHLTTVAAATRLLGAPADLAAVIQLTAAAAAAGTVWSVFRRCPSSQARTAVLAGATLLVSPYAMNYDLLLLAPATVLLYRQAMTSGFLPAERLLYAVIWVSPTLTLALNTAGVPLIPLIILWFVLVAMARLRTARQVAISKLPHPLNPHALRAG